MEPRRISPLPLLPLPTRPRAAPQPLPTTETGLRNWEDVVLRLRVVAAAGGTKPEVDPRGNLEGTYTDFKTRRIAPQCRREEAEVGRREYLSERIGARRLPGTFE